MTKGYVTKKRRNWDLNSGLFLSNQPSKANI